MKKKEIELIKEIFPEPVTPDTHAYWMENINILEKNNITGNKLSKFIKYCCEYNKVVFIMTINLFRINTFTKEEIDNNLSLIEPISFINYDIPMYKKSNNKLRVNEEQKKDFNARALFKKVKEIYKILIEKYYITDSLLEKLIINVCHSNFKEINMTFDAIKNKMFTCEQILNNLSLDDPVSFIDPTKDILVLDEENNIVCNDEQIKLFKERYNERALESISSSKKRTHKF